MYIDTRLQFSLSQAISTVGSNISTNLVDLDADRDIGPGEPLWIVVQTVVALAGTSPTFTLSVQTDDNSGFASATTIFTGDTIPNAAAMPAGSYFIYPFPMKNERYLRLNYTLAGTTPTATITSWLTNQHPQTWAAIADGI
jgi:hypothetical protein